VFGFNPIWQRASKIVGHTDTTRCKMTLDERITFDATQCSGRACIRGMRIRVADILEMLAQGVSEQTILADYPDLEKEDIRACLHFGAQRSGIARLAT
jgi:uncharacterized protein (DUF433 family)